MTQPSTQTSIPPATPARLVQPARKSRLKVTRRPQSVIGQPQNATDQPQGAAEHRSQSATARSLQPSLPSAGPALNCLYFQRGECHSCAWLAVPYAEQLARKQARAARLLAPFTGAAGEPIAWQPAEASLPENFRNKVKLVVTGSIAHPRLGILRDPRTGEGTDLRNCPLPTLGIRTAIAPIARFITACALQPYNMHTDTGVLKYVIIMEAPSGELMVRFVVRRRGVQGVIFKHFAQLREAVPMLQVCSINVQPEHKAIIEGAEEILVSEAGLLPMDLRLVEMRDETGPSGEIGTGDAANPSDETGPSDEIGTGDAANPSGETSPGDAASRNDAASQSSPAAASADLRLFVTPGAFFQTNTMMAEALYSRAAQWLGKSALPETASASAGETASTHADATTSTDASTVTHASAHAAMRTVWDLYCGVGGFGLAIAQANPHTQIVGIETAGAAVAAAQATAEAAGLTARTQFVQADALAWARQTEANGAALPDAIVVNPPRRGIGAELARWINDSGAPHVLYSSCNAVTLARDLAEMPAYTVTKAQVVDMFAHTEHFETIVLLTRKVSGAA